MTKADFGLSTKHGKRFNLNPFDGVARKPTAFHEAGHVVVAMHLGIPFVDVRIGIGRDKQGRKIAGYTRVGKSSSRDFEAAMCLAGYLAQGRHIGKRYVTFSRRGGKLHMRNNGDMMEVYRLLKYRDTVGRLKRARLLASLILSRHWAQVEIIAHLLAKHGKLTRCQLIRELDAMS